MNLLDMLPPAELFLPFLIAGLALNLTPGSDMTFVALAPCAEASQPREFEAQVAADSVPSLSTRKSTNTRTLRDRWCRLGYTA